MRKGVLGMLTALTLLFGAVVTPTFAQGTDSDKICQDAADARKQIEVLDKKYADLKQKAYDEWASQSKSGQYSGTWEEYAQKFIDSAEVKEIQNLRQKYTEIDQKCPQYSPLKPEYSDSKKKNCDNTDYKNIKKTFSTIEQKMIAAKERHYKEWEALIKSGKYSGSWDQYAKEKLYPSPEAMEYQSAREKYGAMIELCQSEQVLPQPKMIQRPAGCNESEFEAAKKTMMESNNKVTALKERLYSEWKLQTDAGKVTDSWDVYMKQHFDGAAEVKEWRQLQEKFSGMIHICTPTNMDIVQPSNPTSLQQSNELVKSDKIISEKKKEADKYDKLKKAKQKKSKKSAPVIINKSGKLVQE